MVQEKGKKKKIGKVSSQEDLMVEKDRGEGKEKCQDDHEGERATPSRMDVYPRRKSGCQVGSFAKHAYLIEQHGGDFQTRKLICGPKRVPSQLWTARRCSARVPLIVLFL